MRKLNLLFFAVMGMMMAAMPVLAQAPAATAAVDCLVALLANRALAPRPAKAPRAIRVQLPKFRQ